MKTSYLALVSMAVLVFASTPGRGESAGSHQALEGVLPPPLHPLDSSAAHWQHLSDILSGAAFLSGLLPAAGMVADGWQGDPWTPTVGETVASRATLYALPVISALNLTSLVSNGVALRHATAFLGRVQAYCGQIASIAQALRSHGDPRWEPVFDLGRCCTFEVSDCSSSCVPPNHGTFGNFARGALSVLPLRPLDLVGLGSDEGSGQTELSRTALSCASCANNVLHVVRTASIRANHVERCGGWRP